MSADIIPENQKLVGYGAWWVAIAAVVAFILSLISYFTPHGPIADSWGALLVVISTALMCIAALLLAMARMRRWAIILLEVLIVLDIAGTGVAAYFLEAYALLALVAIALLGWIFHLIFDFPRDYGK